MPVVQLAKTYGEEPLDMYYEVHGTGPHKIVLIGGYGNICHQWDLQVEYFMQEPTQFSVCIFDNRGAGLSSSPKGRYRTPEMAMDVKELMDHLQWRRFHVVGLSLGGMIAQELAHLCLERVISLTLESTIAYFNGLPAKAYVNMVVSGPPLNTVEEFASHVVNKLLFPKEWLDSPCDRAPYATNREHMIAFTTEKFAITGLQNKAGRASQQNAVITHSMSTRRLSHMKNSHLPVLVLCGNKDDVLIQPQSSRFLAKQLGGRLEIFDGGGHAIRLQFPDRHNQLLKAHILGAVKKELDRLEDRIIAELAVLRSSCGGLAYEKGAVAIRESLEQEFLRNGGRHHFIVHSGRSLHQHPMFFKAAGSRKLRKSKSFLRRKSRASLVSTIDTESNPQAIGSTQTAAARLRLSSSVFQTSLQDLFSPTEIAPSNQPFSGPAPAQNVDHPTSRSFLSWLFPVLPTLLTIEREIVVEQLEFATASSVAIQSTRVGTALSTATSIVADVRAGADSDSSTRDADDVARNRTLLQRVLPSFRALRVGFTDVVSLVVTGAN